MKSSILILSTLCSGYSLFSQYSYDKFVNYRFDQMSYINNPDSKDSTCKNAVNMAESDMKDDKKIFCMPYSINFLNIRFKDELFSILEKGDFSVVWDTITGPSDNYQTTGCYCASVMKYNSTKEGPSFRKDIFQRADDLYAKRVFDNNALMNTWHCDEMPFIKETNETKKYYTYHPTESDSLCEGHSSFDATFIIEKDLSITNVRELPVFRDKDIDRNCVNLLLDNLTQEIEKDNWQPGKLHGKDVRTKVHARLYIKEEMKETE